MEQHADIKCSYESYRKLFNTKFNLSFGYPRKDTCSKCDELDSKAESAETDEEKEAISREKEEHLRLAEVFYARKKSKRDQAKRDSSHIAIAFDFWKNLPVPNITTNDVYYKRQLSVYTFNVHTLHNNDVELFCYDETVARKGADEVCSMLYERFSSVADDVKTAHLFCDGCAGQNKNWTVIRFLYFLVHAICMFSEITVSFPVRGHSYMECDKDMGNVNQKSKALLPQHWRTEFQQARKHPSPMKVKDMSTGRFLAVEAALEPYFRKKCLFKTRPVREIRVSSCEPGKIMHRNNWNGEFTQSPAFRVNQKHDLPQIEFKQAYSAALPISKAKYKDL